MANSADTRTFHLPTWRMVFKSLENHTYTVNIYDKDNYPATEAGIIYLTPSAEPFTTAEDISDNVFTAIRSQTGYIRFVDNMEGTSLLESILPDRNTEKFVYVEDENANRIWQGFLTAESYSQPFDNFKTVIEIPVISIFEAMRYVTPGEEVTKSRFRLSDILLNAVYSLGFDDYPIYWGAVFVGDYHSVPTGEVLWQFVQMWNFSRYSEIVDEGSTTRIVETSSYYDILSDLFSLYGLCAREEGGNYYLIDYIGYSNQASASLLVKEYSWLQLLQIRTGTINPSDIPRWLPRNTEYYNDVDISTTWQSSGTDNNVSTMRAKGVAIVKLDINRNYSNITLPQTDEDASEVIIWGSDVTLKSDGTNAGKIYVQPHASRINDFETYYFYDYLRRTYQGPSTYADILAHTLINGYTANPTYSESNPMHVYTGAFPVRWFFAKNDEEIVELKNGIYLNTQYASSGVPSSNYTIKELYYIRSGISSDMPDGYLSISLRMNSIAWEFGTQNVFYLLGNGIGGDDLQESEIDLRCAIKIGNKFYTRSGGWATGTLPDSYITIAIRNGSIPRGIGDPDHIVPTDTGDFIIPITPELNGEIEFYILNYSATSLTFSGGGGTALIEPCYSHIISQLDITINPVNTGITTSSRSNNTYRRVISLNNPDSEEITLNTGTMNNNKESVSFIRNYSTNDYIETLGYIDNTQRRPETELADKMARYYNDRKKQIDIETFNVFNVFKRYILMAGKKFLALKKEIRWRDDKMTATFLECSMTYAATQNYAEGKALISYINDEEAEE